jgi:type I restriction enzyme M protein
MESRGWTVSEASMEELRRQGRWMKGLEFDFETVVLVAVLLYLRWADHEESEQEARATFDERPFEPALPKALRWATWRGRRGRELKSFLSEELPHALARGGRDRWQHLSRLGDVLSRQQPLFEEWYDHLADWIDSFDFGTPGGRERASAGLELALSRSAMRWKSAQFYTPQPIVDLMVELADPQLGDRVYDPCFGLGGLLVGSARRIIEASKRPHSKAWTGLQSNTIFGVESNPVAYAVGLARIVLAGISEPGLELGDSLLRDPSKASGGGGFDCVLASPPWGGRLGPEYSYRFPISSSDSATLFLQHCMESLRPGGRAVVALPEGVLFRPGSDRKVRQRLLDSFSIESVVSLPAGAFAPCTGVKSSLVVFRRAEPTKAVRFLVVDALTDSRTERNAIAHGTSSDVTGPRTIARKVRSSDWDSHFWEEPVSKIRRRDFELAAKKTGADELERWTTAVHASNPDWPMRELGETVEVLSGVSYGQDTTTRDPNDPRAQIGLIRVSDLERGRLRHPELFFVPNDAKPLSDEAFLREGDLLLSMSGTIGKVAKVRQSKIRLVAAKSIAVLRARPGENIATDFLASLLDAPPFQDWLKGHARGVTIQHLSLRVLRSLVIPLPPLSLQVQVARTSLSDSSAVVRALLRTSGKTESVAGRLLESTSDKSFPADRTLEYLDRVSEVFARFEQEIGPNATLGGGDDEPPFHLLATALQGLRGVQFVERGPGLFAILQHAYDELGHVLAILRDNVMPDDAEFVEECDQRIRGRLLFALTTLQKGPTVDFRLEPPFLRVGDSAPTRLVVTNRSVLPVRNIVIVTSPDIGTAEVPYLRECVPTPSEIERPLKVPNAEPGVVQVTLNWTGVSLAGESLSGEKKLAVEIQAAAPVPDQPVSPNGDASMGSPPYISGNPVSDPQMFFGRKDTLDDIRLQLNRQGQANVVLLEGNRRMGKTSILKQLPRDDALPGWVVAECSLQGGQGHDKLLGLRTGEVFRLLADRIGRAVFAAGAQAWPPGIEHDAAKPWQFEFPRVIRKAFEGEGTFETLELFVQQALEAIAPRRLLLLIDEFDKLQEGIDSGVTSPAVPENIRYLLHTYPALSAVITGGRRIKRLREQYWSALFGFGVRVPVGPLSDKDARALVETPVHGRLVFVPEATAAIVALCDRQPYLIQSFCTRLFLEARRLGTRVISRDIVEAAAKVFVDDNEHFNTLWDFVGPKLGGTSRRQLLLALIETLSHGPDPVTLTLIERSLDDRGVDPTLGEPLGDDLAELRELELVKLIPSEREAHYGLEVPLMGAWMRLHVDIDEVVRRTQRELERSAR